MTKNSAYIIGGIIMKMSLEDRFLVWLNKKLLKLASKCQDRVLKHADEKRAYHREQ